jgi:hypothetical protein
MKQLLPVLFLTILPACPSSSEMGDLQPDGTSYRDYIDAFQSARCARDLRCEDEPGFASEEECLAQIEESLVRGRARIETSVDLGRTLFYPDAVDGCLAAIEGSCELGIVEIAMACNPVLEGAQSVGEPCVGHFECAGDALCFDGCDGIQGDEDSEHTGTCVAESPIRSPECSD